MVSPDNPFKDADCKLTAEFLSVGLTPFEMNSVADGEAAECMKGDDIVDEDIAADDDNDDDDDDDDDDVPTGDGCNDGSENESALYALSLFSL